MPDAPKVKNFNEHLEKSLARIGDRAAVERKSHDAADLSDREIVKRSIQAIAREVPAAPAGAPSSAPVAAPVASAAPDDDHLPAYIAASAVPDAVKRKIESLVHLAFHKGLDEAVSASKKQSYFIEDAFHDALTDKALPELKKRGLLK